MKKKDQVILTGVPTTGAVLLVTGLTDDTRTGDKCGRVTKTKLWKENRNKLPPTTRVRVWFGDTPPSGLVYVCGGLLDFHITLYTANFCFSSSTQPLCSNIPIPVSLCVNTGHLRLSPPLMGLELGRERKGEGRREIYFCSLSFGESEPWQDLISLSPFFMSAHLSLPAPTYCTFRCNDFIFVPLRW